MRSIQHFSATLFLACVFSCITTPFASADTTTVGVLLPLSGSYATIGEDNRQGIEVALDHLGKESNLKLIFADSKADPTIAVNEFRRLVDVEKVESVFAMRGPVGMAVNPLSAANAIPLLGGVGNRDFAVNNKYAFQIWSRSDLEGAFVAQVLKKHDLRNVALITSQDDWPDAVSKGFRDEVSNQNVQIIYDQEILPAETDFRSIISQIRTKSPQVIFANLALAQFAPFLRQLHDQNLAMPVYANFWVAKKEVIEAAGEQQVEGVRFVEMDTNLPHFAQAIKSKFSTNPSAATLAGYIATLLIQQATQAVKKSEEKLSLYEALLQQSEVRTPDGLLAIRNRCVIFPLVERVVRNGNSE